VNRFICIHGHFYQPPRENPWLEEIELQDSAYPYHDWNQRITAECYAPNTASRILDPDKRIIDIVNNYSKINFNFGPTLLNWLAKKEPEVYSAIIDADFLSQQSFSGHGSAIAQVYNHMIMPLANRRDKRTQVVWGIKDFEFRFERKPEGMWLAEAAVDLETLELLAEQGIKFTILAPAQAKRMRKIGSKTWKDVSGGKIDPKNPYLLSLPSGRTIAIFFYDGPISREVAFAGLLVSGEDFANKLVSAFVEKQEGSQLVHIATDGETFGHHHRHGEMALSYCLYHIEKNELGQITNYAEYLEKNPPLFEAEIHENSSWSCGHGVERWRAACGCNTGMKPEWRQEWRAPLRQAMDWLRDNLAKIYEEQISSLLQDPWKARDEYIEVVLDRTEERTKQFLNRQAGRELSWQEHVRARKLLEMQRHAMLMYTSCGWYFDDISGIETVQIMLYAARAMQLAREVTSQDLEQEYVKLLERAPSNLPNLENGAGVYDKFVRPEALDLLRVGAHYAISSLFEDYPATTSLFCYWVDKLTFDRVNKNDSKLAVGQAHVYSSITAEEADITFAVLHLGGEEFIGGVRVKEGSSPFEKMQKEIKSAFEKDGQKQLSRLLDQHFGEHSYSLLHLFRDEQRKILNLVAKPAFDQVKKSLRQIFDQHYQAMRGMNRLRIALPMALYTTAKFVLNNELRQLFEADEFDLQRFQKVVDEVKDWPIKLDRNTLCYHASQLINKLMERCFAFPENINWLEEINLTLKTFIEPPLLLDLDLWKTQNQYFSIGQKLYTEMTKREAQGSADAKRWFDEFSRLGEYLKVRIK
jgi:alpha-amylase/alpha-mannosidase (GH57 family)